MGVQLPPSGRPRVRRPTEEVDTERREEEEEGKMKKEKGMKLKGVEDGMRKEKTKKYWKMREEKKKEGETKGREVKF